MEMPTIDDVRDDVEELTDSDVVVLGLLHNKPIKRTRIQKMSLFIERLFNFDESISHGSYHYGAFSDGIDESLISLKGDGSVAVDSSNNYKLTNYGDLLYSEANNKEELKRKLEAVDVINDFFSSLSDQQLLQLSYLLFPDTTEESLIVKDVQKKLPHSKYGDLSVQTNLSKKDAVKALVEKMGGNQ